MAKYRFVQVYGSWKAGVTSEQVEEKLNLALDWYRYGKGLYLVFTSASLNKWQDRLTPFVEPEGDLFICIADVSEIGGWMSKEFWEWIEKNQQRMRSEAS